MVEGVQQGPVLVGTFFRWPNLNSLVDMVKIMRHHCFASHAANIQCAKIPISLFSNQIDKSGQGIHRNHPAQQN